MRVFLLWAGCLLGASATAQDIAASIEKILQPEPLKSGVWGIHAIDLSTGSAIVARNAGTPMTPASNTKLVTTALALARLGSDHRFRTRVLAPHSPGAQGRLEGDLILLGGGDPTMSAREMPYRKGPIDGDPLSALRALAAQVAAAGVKLVTGDIVGDDTLYLWRPYPDGWTLDDTVWEYGAPVSALTFNDNAQRIVIRAGNQPGGPASVTLQPAVEYFTIVNHIDVRAGAKREVRIRRPAGTRTLLLTGTLPPGSAASSARLAIDDPALYAALAFRDCLEEAGVHVAGSAVARHRFTPGPFPATPGVMLAERLSPPLLETLTVINKVSQNLHAELALREVARVVKGDDDPRLVGEAVEEFLKETGVDEEAFDLSDGSGLSRRGLLSPTALTTLLAWIHRSPLKDAFLSTLPIAAEDGSLERRFPSVRGAGAIRAKTGSLSHVNALSGFVLHGERPMAFSILANHTTSPSLEIRKAIDKIVEALYQEAQR